jgi:hypothetical protein
MWIYECVDIFDVSGKWYYLSEAFACIIVQYGVTRTSRILDFSWYQEPGIWHQAPGLQGSWIPENSREFGIGDEGLQ